MSDGFMPDDGFQEDGFAPEPPRQPRASSNRWLQKVGEGMVPAFNRLTALGSAATDPMFGIGEGEGFGQRYDRNLRAEQAQSAETQREHPYVSAGLQVAGGVPTALATGGASSASVGVKALEPASRLVRAAQGAKTGAGYGAMYGAGDAPAGADLNTLAAHTVGGAALGATFGGGMGALVPSHVPNRAILKEAAANNTEVAAAAPTTLTQQRPPRLLRRIAAPAPTKEAELLMGEGVPLTAGLQNPRSPMGQIETASQSLRAAGPLVTAQRDTARKATQSVILNKVLPPGMKPQRWGEPDEAMDSIYQGFSKAYESVKGQDIYPAIHRNGKGTPLQSRGKSPGAFDEILADKGVMATAETRGQVRAFLENQLSLLPNVAKVEKHGMHSKTTYERPSMVAPVPIEKMLAMRSNIRSQIRTATKGNASREDFAAAEFLKRADQAVTDAIESQVDEATSASLKAIDGQYRNYKILEGAVSKAGDGTLGFNGRQLTNALRESTSQGEFARGGGGDLRPLARAYTRTFDESMAPPTGARLLTVGPLGEWVTGPLVFQMNRPRALPSMPVPPRRALPPGSEAAAALAAALQGKPGPRLSPAYGEEER
jgi:hypothetical protein